MELEQKKSSEKGINKRSSMAQMIVFLLGGEEYALEIEHIKEVVPTPKIAKVPLSAHYIEGVANIRGNILAIVNLEKKFGLAIGSAPGSGSYTLVVEQEELQIGFIVHAVPNTLSVGVDQIDESPSLIQSEGDERKYIKGIIKVGERLIVLLDINTIIQKSEVQSAVG